MSCTCRVHFDQRLLDHIEQHRNAEAKSMLNANLAKTSNCRGTLLHHAALVGNDEVSRLLTELGSPVDFPGPDEKTPLMCVVEFDGRHRKRIVRILLASGANINAVDARGESALYKVLKSADDLDFKVMEALLLRAKAESSTSRQLAEKLLAAGCHFPYAALVRDVDVLDDLLLRGFDVNSRTNRERRTALHFAVLAKDLESARLLIERGADVNALDVVRCGPLYYAADVLEPRAMRLLLDRGADPHPPKVRYYCEAPLFAPFVVGDRGDDERVRECAELLLLRGEFPWNARSFVSEISYREILRGSRLNELVAQQALLDALGVETCDEGKHLTEYAELRDYYGQCRRALDVAVLLGETTTTTTLIDLLNAGREMRNRARDPAFVRRFERLCAESVKELHPYYAKVLANRVCAAVRTVNLEDEAVHVLCGLFRCGYNQLNVFARRVVGYLSERDLEQLGRV